jgi:hypothetical protein
MNASEREWVQRATKRPWCALIDWSLLVRRRHPFASSVALRVAVLLMRADLAVWRLRG